MLIKAIILLLTILCEPPGLVPPGETYSYTIVFSRNDDGSFKIQKQILEEVEEISDKEDDILYYYDTESADDCVIGGK